MIKLPFNLRPKKSKVAYFSMEFALNSQIPNYAGGLGVLAADIIHSMADMEYPAVGVGLMYHQNENPALKFHPEFFMKKLSQTVKIQIEGKDITVGGYQYNVLTPNGKTLPIYFLTTFSGDNPEWVRNLTRYLYPSDQFTRLAQEAILGIGGVKMLRALGHNNLKYFHLNEGHAALATLELLRENNFDDEKVKKICRFTTHTPIKAGHDKFPYDLAYKVLGDQLPWHIKDLATKESLSMTHLALNLSGKANAVSLKHKKVCEEMFPKYKFEGITNSIYTTRWASEASEELFDKYLKGWRQDPSKFGKASDKIPNKALLEMRAKNKIALIDWINENPGFFCFEDIKASDLFKPDILTIVFARRFVPYKRPLLFFHDIEKLKQIGNKKIQIIFAGHCHPDDNFCNTKKATLRHFAKELRKNIKIAVIPDYNLHIAQKLVAGANIWLNNPVPPREASGTSGMKAALNGGLNLSVLDGWWIEGLERKPKSGWGFAKVTSPDWDEATRDDLHATEMYEKLEDAIKCFYKNPDEWLERSKESISLLGHFNGHRLIKEYDDKMWN